VWFFVEHVFREGNRYTDLVQEKFAEKFPGTLVPRRNAVCRLNKLKTAITAYIRNISPADLQKKFADKFKWVLACIDALGHHFQQLL
jgi:hypothetical protein